MHKGACSPCSEQGYRLWYLRYLGGAGYSSSPNVVFNYLGDFGVSGSASGGEVFGYRGGSWGSGISSAGPRTSQLLLRV
ncbi:hypothetical protein OHD16_27180 [Sphingobacterium sp. ML3W]|uniref:hypothetical protein n=1 Tax=Sphingobacterium sp. ML3W TaxID=1538644 RepID=UPI0030089A5F